MAQSANQTATTSKLPGRLVTCLVVTMAVLLSLAQVLLANVPNTTVSLVTLNQLVPVLRQMEDPVQRDAISIEASAAARRMDRGLSKDARVFVGGMIGKTNGSHLGNYCFLRYYLFPRNVEVSLHHKPVFRDGWFDGTASDSPAELRASGFDLLVLSKSNSIDTIALTPRGSVNWGN